MRSANFAWSVGMSRLAFPCRSASGAGAPASFSCAAARSNVSGCGALVLPPLWARPMTTTAITATAPRAVRRRRRDMGKRVVGRGWGSAGRSGILGVRGEGAAAVHRDVPRFPRSDLRTAQRTSAARRFPRGRFSRRAEPFMAEPMPPAVVAASVPDPTLVARAEAFTRERFVHEGEDASIALAPGSARRRALDAALAEIERGEKVPSTKWRRPHPPLPRPEAGLAGGGPVPAA